MAATTLRARDLRTKSGRTALTIRRAIGTELRRLREDAGLSLRDVAHAAHIAPSHLSAVERGVAEPSLAVLAAITGILGADVSVRIYPGVGPRIRDHLQAPIVEALLRAAHPSWKRIVEVAVRQPVRGVIDVVLARPGTLVVSAEVHSEIRRLEQQMRWASAKTDALPSSDAWSMLKAGSARVSVEPLLVLRNTRTNRELVTRFEETLRAHYPASTQAVLCALGDPDRIYPGAALLWAEVTAGHARLLDSPPRGVRLGR